MAIYLDANILYPWRSFTELDRVALSIVARQLGQEIYVPEVVAREARAHYRRSLQAAEAAFDAASAHLDRKFGQHFDPILEPAPDIDERLDTWERGLRELATVLPLHADDARAAFEREIDGKKPAKLRPEEDSGGGGGRDAAIWLTILRDLATREEDGYLLSTNHRDFGQAGGLHPDLAEEAAGRIDY